jgi:hypothetical protein
MDRNVLLAQIIRLQYQILSCESKIVELLLSKQFSSDQENAKALHDEIFGCEIEIQSLRLQISKLKVEKNARPQ